MKLSEIVRRRQRAEEMRGQREKRAFGAQFELRSADGDRDTVTMVGHASVTEFPYEIGDPSRGGYVETIARNAFRRSLSQGPRVVLLANHEGLPLASTAGGSLDLTEDERGLAFVARMDATDPDVDRVVRKVRRGDLTDASFAFRVTDQKWDADYTARRILSVELTDGDVSICTVGANPAASVALRSQARSQPATWRPDPVQLARERLALLERDEILRRRARRELVAAEAAAPEAADPVSRAYRGRLALLRRAV